MAKKNLMDLIRAVRFKIDEPYADYVTDAELTEYINAAINDMSDDLFLESYRTIHVDTPTKVIPYSELFIDEKGRVNFQSIINLYVNGRKMNYGTVEDKHDRDVFYLFDESVHFSTEVSGEIEVYYNKKASELENPNDTTDIPEKYEQLIIYFAAAEFKEKDTELEEAAHYRNLYEAKKYEMKQEMEEKQSNGAVKTVKITDYMG